MKKILTILAASAMFFAFGEDISNGINFEAYTAYGEGSFNPLGDDPGTESQYWYSASSVGNVISNHVAAPVLPSGVTVPDLFKDDNSNTNFLYLETESPLFRTVKTNGHVPAEFEGVSITTNPIYLDTLVKFTAADSAFTSFEDAADKIAIEYVEHEEESHEDQTTGETVIDSAGFTNFVIRAGYVVAADNSATIVETNYYAAVPEGFDKDAWHRLTVRSIANIDGTGTGKGHVGFVVYLDQVPLKYATSVAVGNATFESNLNADVTKNFYNSETPIHALYPSAVDPEELTGQKISAVAFSGNGSVDDVVFTTTKPGFINESSIVTVTWDEHVATLTLNGEAVADFVAGEAGSTTIEPDNGAVLVGVTFASGWEAGTFTTDGNGSWDSATSSFVDLASGEICNIVSMHPLYSVSDGTTTTKYDDLEAALGAAAAGTAQAPATLKLLADCDQALIFNTGVIILDLAGCDVQGGVSDDYSIANVGATLIVTNSGTEAAVKIPLSANPISLYQDNNGFTTITAGTFEGAVFVYFEDPATAANYLCITGGKFLDTDYATYGTFYLAECVPAGISTTYISEETMVQVGGGGDTPTEIAVPTAVEGLVYNKSEQTGVVGGEGYTLVGNVGTNAGSYTAIATLQEGYAWEGGSTAPAEIVWYIGMKGVTPRVVLTPSTATLDPTKTTVGDYTEVAAYDGDDLMTVNLDYIVNYLDTEVTTAGVYSVMVAQKSWDPGQNYMVTNSVTVYLTITAGGSYPSYIDTTDDTIKGKYDAWAQTYGADTGSAYEAAFLLNVDPDTGDTTLDATNIVISGTTVTITIDHEGVNGYPYVLQAATLDGLKTATPTPATIGAGGVITLTSSAAAQFFKVGVSATPIAVP